MQKLTKTTLIDKIKSETGLNRRESSQAVEALLEAVKGTLAKGEDVLLSGFGKFCAKDKSSRKGRNPATGKEIILPPRRVVTFKCSAKLRDRLNSSNS